MDLKIEDKALIDWILINSQAQNLSENAFIIAIINNYKSSFEAKNAKKPLILDIEDDIISIYRVLYKDRFNIDSNEDINKNLILKIFNKINIGVKNKELTLNILKKALAYYLFIHKSEKPNGEKYPYLMRIFLEQEWLTRQCIEASSNLTVDMIKKIGNNSTGTQDIIKALKRGDYENGFNNNFKPELEKEKLLTEVENCIRLYNWNHSLRNHPKISKLYSVNIPSADYLHQAKLFLERAKNESNI